MCKHCSVVNDHVIIIQTRNAPLHVAAFWGHTDSVALLAANGADVNMKDRVS